MGVRVRGRPTTDPDWLAAADPPRMLESLRGQASSRKLRLIAVAACGRIPHLMTDARSRSAVEVADRYVGGATAEGEQEAADPATADAWV